MKYEDILKISGKIPKCKILKKKHFEQCEWFPGGDAPKDFIKAYFYKKGHIRANNWCYYIAKVGHKHYPIESITEYLLNNIGQIFGMNMQETGLIDTMWDLIVDSIGALFASSVGYWYLKSGSPAVFDKIVKKFVRQNRKLFRKN